MAKHLPKGRIGNLTAADLNELSEAAQNSADVGTSQTPIDMPVKPIASGRFPIFVTLGNCVKEEDVAKCVKEEEEEEGSEGEDDGGGEDDGKGGGDKGKNPSVFHHGYEWTEIGFSRVSQKWGAGGGKRRYVCKNAAFAIGVDADQPYASMPVYAGESVMLFPANDKEGNPLLVFEPPAPQAVFFPARITSVSGNSCNIDPEESYELVRVDVSMNAKTGQPIFIDVEDEGSNFDAVNLAEVNGADFGGQIANGSGSCNVSWSPTPIPVGTVVFVKQIGFANDTKLYGFFAVNDKCVVCCDEEGFMSTQRNAKYPAQAHPNYVASRVQSAVDSSIEREMKR